MGGKGQRRREKNFLAAHGDDSRLPPPPNLKELEALPSKLRKIMQLKNQGSLQSPGNRNRKKRGSAGEKKANSKDERSSFGFNLEKEDNIRKTSGIKIEEKDALTNPSSSDTKKRKRKRKTVDDLRFHNLDQAVVHSRRKERKKEYFESKKKKQKKDKTDDILNFPGREEIKFGDIVEAPPKLSFPKKLKASIDASKERIRLQAVDAYRNRRGWTSGPGVKLPMFAESPPS